MSKKSSPGKQRRFEETTIAASIAAHTPSPRPEINERLLTIGEVARILHASRSFVYALLRSGELPSFSLRRLRRIRATDLDEFVKSERIRSEDGAGSQPRKSKSTNEPVEGRLERWRRERGGG